MRRCTTPGARQTQPESLGAGRAGPRSNGARARCAGERAWAKTPNFHRAMRLKEECADVAQVAQHEANGCVRLRRLFWLLSEAQCVLPDLRPVEAIGRQRMLLYPVDGGAQVVASQWRRCCRFGYRGA